MTATVPRTQTFLEIAPIPLSPAPIQSQDEGEIDTLEILTEDRSALMTKVRHNYFNSEKELSEEDRNFVLDVTILFENVVQILSRYGLLLKS